MCATQDDGSAHSGVNIHIDADGLARHHRERLRCCASAFGCPPWYVKNVISRGQFKPIISAGVCVHSRDLLLAIPVQNDQRIIRVISSRCFSRRVCVLELNFLERNDLQMSLQEPWWSSVNRGAGKQKN